MAFDLKAPTFRHKMYDGYKATRHKMPDELAAQMPVLKKTTELLGIYSPLGFCGQTSFALALAQILGREKSVLYLNMEEYSGFEELFEKEYPYTLSDLLYFVRQEQAGITVKMNSMIQSMGSMDFIPPVQSPEDIRGTRWQDWEHLLQEIVLHSSYEAVILDVGDGIEEVFQILDLCTRVYVPVRDDRISKCKMEQFEKLLRLRDYSQLLAGIEKVLLPILSQNADNEFRIEELVWSELGDFVRELLEKENL